MIDELLIEAKGDPLRAAAIANGRCVDILEVPRRRTGATGSIYLGRVVRLAPGLAGAFVELGLSRPALIELDRSGQTPARRLAEGAPVVVQVVEEAADDKGARASPRVALAGRTVLLLPGDQGVAASRRLPAAERPRLMAAVKRVLGAGEGAIVRAAAAGAAPEEVTAELAMLRKRWLTISTKRDASAPPALLEDTGDGFATLMATFAPAAPRRIVVDDAAATRALKAAAGAWPELEEQISAASPDEPLFERYDVADAWASREARWLALPSGGRIAIERTAALTAIDVDSGAGATATGGAVQVNLEAVVEVARQLRLRDVRGLVLVDFIRGPRADQARIVAALRHAIAGDRRLVHILGWSNAGLCELVREARSSE